MESNDSLNLQNDKEIEKLIPFDIGRLIASFDTYFACRTHFILGKDL